ncbi:MAG TPA: hypothetical protein PLV92_17995, partial [Pirellulaceae bacterium]|nr:hypothetical protein [Pirellulaceae bacterium]
EKKRQKIKTMLDEARGGKGPPVRTEGGGASLIGSLFGAKMRFLAGCLLMAVCLIWAKQNGMLRQEVVDDVREAASQVETKPSARLLGVLELLFPTEANPLPWPLIGRWFDSINPGVAGLVLVATSLLGRGLRTGLFAFAAAAVLIFGAALGVPGVAALGGAQATCFVIGLALGVAGVILRGR